MKNTPFNVMRHNDWDRAPRDPITLFTYAVSTLGFSTVGAVLFSAGATIAISAVTSWAVSALTPKPASGVGTQGILTNARNPAAPHEYVYGEVRKGGVITYLESTGENNKFLHQIIVLAGHEVEEIGDIYINDEVVALNGGNFVTSAPWNSKIRIQKFDGTQTTAPASLLAESNQINANFIGRGLAYIYIRLEYDQDVFVNGIPLFTAKVKSKKVFDPRTSTTAYSANAALCIRDYLVTDYGMADVGSTNDTLFSAAANVCDEELRLTSSTTAGNFVVGKLYEIITIGTTDFTAIGASANTVGVFFVATGAGTGTGVAYNAERRYEMNGVISAALAPGNILQSAMTSCAGTLFWGQGKWQLRPGYYTAPTKTFTLDDLRGPISLSTRTSRRDNYNIVRGKFNDAAQRYITSDYPELRGDAFIIEDNNLQNALDLELPLTTSAAMAQRLAKLTLFRGREQMSFSADFSMAAFDVQVGDIIALTNPRYGWTDKEFEVLGWRFAADGDAGDLRVNLSLRETSEAAFDWDAEEEAIISNNTNLPNAFRAIPFGLNITSEVRVVNEHLTNVIFAEVTSSESFNIDRVEVQFRKTGEEGWKVAGVGQIGTFEILDTEGSTYDIRARTYSVLGVRSEFETRTNFVVSGLADPPANVTGLTAEINGASVHLEWDPVPDLDLSFYRIRHAAEESGATWANATTVVDKVPRPANSITVPAKSGSYMIRAFDKTGNASVEYTTVVIPTEALEGFATTLTQSEHPSFAGTKTDCSVVSNELLITNTVPLATGILQASLGAEPGLTLFGNTLISGRPLGDIDNSGTVTSFDALQALKYSSGALTEQNYLDYINLVMIPYMVENKGTYAAYLPPFTATYEFGSVIDTGAVRRFRARIDLETRRLNDSADLWDDQSGLFDDLPGLFDNFTGAAQFADTNIITYIATTNDDPAGAPTWTDWKKFRAGDFYARAAKFKIELISNAMNVKPAVDTLIAKVEHN
tara:strand:- start:3926 stop:6880 length:2955 start_codon:yes stop_codon:yes gene_type:complete